MKRLYLEEKIILHFFSEICIEQKTKSFLTDLSQFSELVGFDEGRIRNIIDGLAKQGFIILNDTGYGEWIELIYDKYIKELENKEINFVFLR